MSYGSSFDSDDSGSCGGSEEDDHRSKVSSGKENESEGED